MCRVYVALGVGVSTPFLAPCVSLHVRQIGVGSPGGPL